MIYPIKYILLRQEGECIYEIKKIFEEHTETQVHEFISYNNSRHLGHLLAHARASAILKYNLKIYYSLHIYIYIYTHIYTCVYICVYILEHSPLKLF